MFLNANEIFYEIFLLSVVSLMNSVLSGTLVRDVVQEEHVVMNTNMRMMMMVKSQVI